MEYHHHGYRPGVGAQLINDDVQQYKCQLIWLVQSQRLHHINPTMSHGPRSHLHIQTWLVQSLAETRHHFHGTLDMATSELATTVTELAAVCNTFSPRGPASPYGTAEPLSHTAKIYSPQKWQAFINTSCCVLWVVCGTRSLGELYSRVYNGRMRCI